MAILQVFCFFFYYQFMFKRYQDLRSSSFMRIRPIWPSIFCLGKWCFPLGIVIVSVFFLSSFINEKGTCVIMFPAYINIAYAIGDTVLSSIGFYLLVKPLWYLRKSCSQQNHIRYLQIERKVIQRNFMGVLLSNVSTFLYLIWLTYCVEEESQEFSMHYGYGIYPIFPCILSLSISITFGDFSFQKLKSLGTQIHNTYSCVIGNNNLPQQERNPHLFSELSIHSWGQFSAYKNGQMEGSKIILVKKRSKQKLRYSQSSISRNSL